MNLYCFTRNNPVSLFDSDGRWIIPVVLAAAAWQGTCAVYAANRGVEAFPTNDKKQHCMISCVHNRCTALNAPVTLLGGILWEIVSGGVFEWTDILADMDGILSSYNIFKSCKDSCDKCPVK